MRRRPSPDVPADPSLPVPPPLSGLDDRARQGADAVVDREAAADGAVGQARFRGPRAARIVALADQVFSGFSNFLAVALIARSSAPETFGHFAVVYALFVAVLSLARRLWGTRLSMTATPDEALQQLRRLLGTTLYATPAAMCVIALPSLAVTD